MGDAVLQACGVSKRYQATQALDAVDFPLAPGRITALVGENGAGKSTLVRILGGIEAPTSGELRLDGHPVEFRSVRDAEARGIAVIHQELNLCSNLSVSDNIFLAREETTLMRAIDRRSEDARARELLDRLEHPLDPVTLVADLPLGQRQIVEIARALSREVRVLMMDEPTSALSARETGALFRIIRDLASRGVAVVYISHRLVELLDIADDVSVLRDGKMVARAPAGDIDARWIVEQMTGRSGRPSESVFSRSGNDILNVEDLSLTDPSGRQALKNVSFRVRSNEVLGLYGLLGAGLTAALESVMGIHRTGAGRVLLDGESIDALGPADRLARGLALVPEDRQGAGLVPTLPVRANMTLSSIAQFVQGVWISDARERQAALAMTRDLGIRGADADADIRSLSGGNQQKVVIGKALLARPRVLLLDEPTRGVDVGAKADIHALIQRLAAAGMAVVVATSDLHDIRATAHRVVVLSRGAVTAELSREDATDEALAQAAGAGWTEDRAS